MKTVFNIAIGIITLSTAICLTTTAQPIKAVVARKSSPSYDPDAQAFLTAAGITDVAMSNAVNNLVINAKAHGWWSSCNAIYPMVGGTAVTHKYNLKDPRDLDAAFRLVFHGTITHNSNGITGSPTAWIETFFNPSTNLAVNSAHLSFYSRSSFQDVTTEMGNYNSAGDKSFLLRCYLTGTGISSDMYSSTSERVTSTSLSDGLGFTLSSRVASNDFRIYRNGVQLAINSTTRTNSPDNSMIYLLALNQGGATQNSNRNCAFATIGAGVNSTVASSMYSDIQTFQAALARQVESYDPDAQAFVTATGITNGTIINAVNNLVVSAKAHGWWSLCNAIYPMAGGTATTCKYNLKDPRDLDVAFRLTFNGSPTFASTGVTWGTNKYADTHLVPNTTLSQNSSHFSIWCRTATAPASFGGSAIGGDNSTNPYFELSWDGGSTPRIFFALNSILDNGQTPVSRNGLTLITRGSSSTIIYYFNGTQIVSTTRTSSTPSTYSVFLGAYHETPSGVVDGYDNGEYAFVTLGSNISSGIQSVMYSDIQTFNTALGR